MYRVRVGGAVALVALLALAGCAAAPADNGTRTMAPTTAGTADPTVTADPTAEPTPGDPADDVIEDPSDPDEYAIQVQGSDLPYDPNVTFARAQSMLGTNATAPDILYQPNLDAAGRGGGGRIFLSTDDESVAAHEFVHEIQRRQFGLYEPADSADAQFATDAIIEGSAEYVQGAYAEQYLGQSTSDRDLPSDPGYAYFIGRYVEGERYVSARVDSVGEVVDLWETPPNTSEQILHGLAPRSEAPTPFAAVAATKHLASDATWKFDGASRIGEFGTMITLRTRLPGERARTAAAGWGNDRVVTFEHAGGNAFVWLTDWDTAADADEFEEATREFAAAPPADEAPRSNRRAPDLRFARIVWGDQAGAEIDVRRVGDEAVLVAIGPDRFRDAVAVTERDDIGFDVRIGPPE